MPGLFNTFQRPMSGGRGFFGLPQGQNPILRAAPQAIGLQQGPNPILRAAPQGMSPVPMPPPTMMPNIAPGIQPVSNPMNSQMPPAPNQGLGMGTDGAPNIDPRKMQFLQNRMNLGFGRGFQPGGGMMN